RRYLKAAQDVDPASRRFSRQASQPVRQAAKGANISAMCAAPQGVAGNKPPTSHERRTRQIQFLSITPIAISAFAHIVKVRYKIRTVTMRTQ
ncbi:hypothetical protein, partial [Paraburkholderia bannensis]|uniref:hypothetical protein n=1 Tax=Paraburkholderia bannensis TaxID=765414 RepID=UPI002AB2F01C